jgi:hypothetical protein
MPPRHGQPPYTPRPTHQPRLPDVRTRPSRHSPPHHHSRATPPGRPEPPRGPLTPRSDGQTDHHGNAAPTPTLPDHRHHPSISRQQDHHVQQFIPTGRHRLPAGSPSRDRPRPPRRSNGACATTHIRVHHHGRQRNDIPYPPIPPPSPYTGAQDVHRLPKGLSPP